jgi:hypothetical protein
MVYGQPGMRPEKPQGPMRIAFLSLGTMLTLCAGVADGQVGPKIPGLTYQFDIRPAVDHPERLGLDFNVKYETSQGKESDPRGLHYALRALGKGFQTFADVPDVNSMTGEISLVGHYYRQTGTEPLPPELIVRYLRVADTPVENLTTGDEQELSRILDRILGKRSLFTFDAHYRYETNHDVTEDDHAIGAGVAGEVPVLSQMLDIIPSLTRPAITDSAPRFRSQPVRFYVGVDRVSGADETTIGNLTGDSRLWRGRLELAWGARIMQGFVLRGSFEAHYFFGANQALKDSDREFDTFLQAWLLYPLSDKTSLLVKYIDGRLPPDYDATKSGKVGLSIALH